MYVRVLQRSTMRYVSLLSDMCACAAQGESQLNVVLLVLSTVSLYSVSPNSEPGGGKMAFKQVEDL